MSESGNILPFFENFLKQDIQMEMFTIGDTSYRISEIFMVQRPYENGRYGVRTYLKGLNVPVDCWCSNEKERDNVYKAMLDAIEDN